MTCTWGISPSIVAAINKLKNSNSALGIRTLQLTRSARNRTLKGRHSYLLRSRLDFRSSMISRIEFWGLSFDFRVSRFTNQISRFKFWESSFEGTEYLFKELEKRFPEDYEVNSIAVIKINSHPRPSSLGRPNINVCISGTLHPVSVFIFIKKSGHNACVLRKLTQPCRLRTLKTKKDAIQYKNKFFKKFAFSLIKIL